MIPTEEVFNKKRNETSQNQESLSAILATSELLTRNSRSANFQAEAQSFSQLAADLLNTPKELFAKISDTAMKLCESDSAGISIIENLDGTEQFRWKAASGRMAPLFDGVIPRKFSACGVVVDAEMPQLFKMPIRYFNYISALDFPLNEILLVPFLENEKVIGTLWVAAHSEMKKFDREDLRILTSLSRFASTALQIAKQNEQAQAAIAKSKLEASRLETIFEKAPISLALLEGPEHRYRLTNSKYQNFFLNGKPYLGKTVSELIPDAKMQGIVDRLNRVYRTAERDVGNEMYFEMVTGNGFLEHFYLNFVYEPVFGSDGEVEGILAAISDVTEQVELRMNAEVSARALANERHKLETLFRSAPAAMALFRGPRLIFEKANPQFRSGVADREVIGKPLLEALPEVKDTPFLDFLLRTFETGETFTAIEFESKMIRQKNVEPEIRYSDVTYLRINDTDGLPYGVYVHSVDVTEKVLARKNLEAAKQEAERANELKSAFLANMSHEIRTPLGAMLGFADLLRDPNLTAQETNNYLDILSKNGESLSVIINDILDLSKVEAGHLIIEYTEAKAEEIISDIVSLLRVTTLEKGLALGYKIEDSTPKSMITDPTRIRQVLINLLGNAIKFTPLGAINIRTYGSKTAEGRNILCIEVDDTGIGVPEIQKESVFAMFVQADGTTTRRFGGTGLGLALSRKLARALGGDVTIIRTSQGLGTTFLFTILDQPEKCSPEFLAQAQKFSRPLELTKNILEGVKVLVVDDSPDNQQIISHYLTRNGARVDSADDGFKGYRKALAGDFDIVLMDIQMPEMDGYTATHKLRTAGYRKPIIALTAHAMSEIRQKCLNVGCSAHLAKPINVKELITTVAEYSLH